MSDVLEVAARKQTGRQEKAEPALVVRLSELVGALSFALDLTEGQPPGHSLRCCLIGTEIGRRLGLSPARLTALYYTLLLKDAGCSSNAARLWELYGVDDRTVKRNVKTVDLQSRGQILRFLLHNTGTGEGAGQRLRRLLHIVRNGEVLAQELVAARCERGSAIATRMGFGERVACGIYSLDEHWNGGGWPDGLSGTAIPLEARIALLAQVIDVFHAIGGRAGALREIDRRVGTWFDPSLVMLFREIARHGRVWEGLAAEGLEARVAELEPVPFFWKVDEARLDAVAGGFADIVDAKSSFTAGHSRRVAALTDAIASRLGLPAERRRWLTRAALLHDLGKLGVSNAILDKPGRLDEAEWVEIRRHPALSEEILRRVGVFRRLAPIAGAHHERLDGKGYPQGLAGEAIPLDARILTTADIFDAITAARPYRRAASIADALSTMDRDRGTALDGRCLDALRATLESAPELSA